MILILEGADGTGKTRAASRAAVTRPAWYRHANQPTNLTWISEYVQPLEGLKGDAVLDRWHVGEAVWPSLFGRKSLYRTLEDLRACCRILAHMDAKLVIVERDYDAIMDTLRNRGESVKSQAVAMAGQKKFMDLAELVGGWMPTRVVDSDALYIGEVDLWNW